MTGAQWQHRDGLSRPAVLSPRRCFLGLNHSHMLNNIRIGTLLFLGVYMELCCALCHIVYCVILCTVSYCVLCHVVYYVISCTLSCCVLCHIVHTVICTVSYGTLCHMVFCHFVFCHFVFCVIWCTVSFVLCCHCKLL